MAPLVVLNVAEKPSVARALAGVFAQMPGSRDRPMRREAAQIFTCDNVVFPSVLRQGDGRTIQGGETPHTMITSSVRGHLASQDFGPQYGWSTCPPVTLFEAPIETLYRPDMVPLERMLQTLSRQAQVLILWLDCDREGEAISDEVREVCLGANAQLGTTRRVFRARFSTVMPQEIRNALCSLGRVNEAMVHAVQARSQLDLRVGAAFTRFQTLRLQKKFEGFSEQGVVSYGPCQFPTLGFVVERWARIETFVPEEFWFLEMSVRLNEDGTTANETDTDTNAPPRQQQAGAAPRSRPIHMTWKRNRLYDRVLTMVLYESCLEAGEAVVTSLDGRPRNKWRPVPLATVELQKRASRYLRIGSETLMTAAEELYQQGYISYPRTETEKFRPEFEHMPLIQSFQGVGGDLGEYATKLLSDNNFQNPRAGPNDDNAHPPITPCKAVDPQTIADPTQRSIYVLVVKHYLACCSRDAIGKETELTLKMASEEFTAKGLMILERNWLEIYAPWERWSTGQGELPRVRVGSRIVPTSLLMKDGRTTPPHPISEVELISLMDKNGIGTDATIAQHISTIQDRKYATKDGQQKFHPTKLGIALVEGYNSMGYQLNKPDLRREMEHECNMVASGRKTKEDIMSPILQKMLECFNTANREAHKLDQAVSRHFDRLGSSDRGTTVLQNNFSLCGACDSQMSLKQLVSTANPRNNQANRGGNATNNIRKKIVFCATCNLGLALPRGDLKPHTEAQSPDQPFRCPICKYQVIKIETGEGYTGNGYHICPKCFSDSPAEFGGLATSGDFRCFGCTHPTCSLAGGTKGGDVEVYPCPFCLSNHASGSSGKVTLRKNSRGYILSCSNYVSTTGDRDRCQYTVWLPKAATQISVEGADDTATPSMQTVGVCRSCSTRDKIVRKLKFVWKSGSVPPHFDRECISCILCDEMLRQDMDINLPKMNQVQSRRRGQQNPGRSNTRIPGTARVHGANGRTGGRGQDRGGSGGGGTCFRCGQAGHYANTCQNEPIRR